MAVDIGYEAIDRASFFPDGYTLILKDNPAAIAGKITTIDLYVNEAMSGIVIATFINEGGNVFTARDSEAVANQGVGQHLGIAITDLDVGVGDYIGIYWSSGKIENDTDANCWIPSGDKTACSSEDLGSVSNTKHPSFGGYITAAAGWTGKISGVTNPAKVMGIDVANIAKVKGVA